MRLRAEFDLQTLQIKLDPGRKGAGEVVFQTIAGRDEPTEVARCALGLLGVPATRAGFRSIDDDDALGVPPAVLAAIQQAVSGQAAGSALWLEFPSPRGNLYVIPWERLLDPLHRALLRLPYHLVRPQRRGSQLDVAICASAPLAKSAFDLPRMVDMLVSVYQRLYASDVTVHVFADAASYRRLSLQLDDGPGVVVLHDPASAAGFAAPQRSRRLGGGSQLSSPWLLWMREAMGGQPLDIVHFLTHGYLAGDRGALACATTPTVNDDRGWARFVGAAEITTFLAQVGGWGIVMSGPPGNFSQAGLRALGDEIATERPGMVIIHDFGRDWPGHDLRAVLQMVLNRDSRSTHPMPSITCWVHPRFVQAADHPAFPGIADDGTSTLIRESTRVALTGHDTEAWVAAASRALEAQQAQWLPGSSDEAVDPAALTALQNVANLVARHVDLAYPGGGTSKGDDVG